MTDSGKRHGVMGLPDSFPVPVLDRVQHLAREFSDQSIRAVIRFDGEIDAARLERSALLTLLAAPVLGCRYDDGFWRPGWRRPNTSPRFVKMVTPAEGKSADNLTIEPDNHRCNSSLRIILARAGCDTLYVTLDHAIADAAGLKDYLYLLAAIYRELSVNSKYLPPSNINGSRSLWQVYKRLSAPQIATMLKGVLKKRGRTPTWTFPIEIPNSNEPFMVIRRLDPFRFNNLREFGRRNRATVNDVLLAAYYRAIAGMAGTSSKTRPCIGVTIDLRRYLPSGKADTICNLFSTVWHDIGGEIGDSLAETTGKVRNGMACIYRDLTPLAALLPYVTLYNALPYAWHKAQSNRASNIQPFDLPPRLTNMGAIDTGALVFSGVNVTDAYLLAPFVYPPAFQVGVSTFRDVLTLSVLSRGDGRTKETATHFLDRFEGELPK